MQPTVLHQQRVAWDAALALITAARTGGGTFGLCRDRIAAILGSTTAAALEATRRRLTAPNAAPNEGQVQTGLWRVRLDDALRSDPSAAQHLHHLAAEVTARSAY